MPQPLSKTKHHGKGYTLATIGTIGDRAILSFQNHKPLAWGITECIAAFSQVDTAVFNIYTLLVGGPASHAYQVYIGLTQPARNHSISTMIRLKCSPQEVALFGVLNQWLRSERKTRDRFAHGTFGFIWGESHAFLISDPAKSEGPDGNSNPDEILVFTNDELDKILLSVSRLYLSLKWFEIMIRPEADALEKAEIYEQILKEPEISTRMSSQDPTKA